MELSEDNLSQKLIYFSPQKPIKKIANSNSSSLLRVGKIKKFLVLLLLQVKKQNLM